VKVLLVFPPQTRPAVQPVYGTTMSDVGTYPPLGLLYIAAYLEKYSNHSVYVLDAPINRMTHDQVGKYVETQKPDIVGVYSTTDYFFDVITCFSKIKSVLPRTVTVVGGPHTYLYPRKTVRFPEIDYVVCGEGEVPFLKLVNALSGGASVEQIPGVLSKENINQPVEIQRNSDIEALPFPARHLTDYRKYSSILAYSSPIATMVTSRGCPYHCYFCSKIESGQKPRTRSPKNVVDEIEICTKMGISDFMFFDELFTFSKERVLGICDEIQKRRLKIRWQIRSRADVLDEEIVHALKKAGCRLIQFGIESGSPHIQRVLNKRLNLRKVRECIKMVKSAGILTYGDFMLGSPEETIEEMHKTILFAKSLGLNYAVFSITQILPGTVLHNMALSQGLIDKDYWREYVMNPEKRPEKYYWPGKFTPEQMEKIARYAYHSFYIRPYYLWKNLWYKRSPRQFLWQAWTGIKTFIPHI